MTKTIAANRRKLLVPVAVIVLLILAAILLLNWKSTADMTDIISESIQGELTAISSAALRIVNEDDFAALHSQADADANPGYSGTLARLQLLAQSVGASNIYAVRQTASGYQTIYSTNAASTPPFGNFTPAQAHLQAFAGQAAAMVQTTTQAGSTLNTGAVPILQNGTVAGIVGVDIEDVYIAESLRTARNNFVVLAAAFLLAAAALLTAVFVLGTRVQRMQGKLQQLAHVDAITGLPNRQYLIDYLGSRTGAAAEVPFALFFIDLDNFKQVNDSAGHDAGDELLRQIAQYLSGEDTDASGFPAPQTDTAMLAVAARVGGDEFIKIVPGVASPAQAEAVATRLLANFQKQAFRHYIDKYGVGLSIGISLYPLHGSNYQQLVHDADTAMYEAKRSGKNQYRLYCPASPDTAAPGAATSAQ